MTLLRPLLIGESGLEPDRVSEKLRQSMFWHGRGGSVEHTISGIDIALWDLCGKALGQPVARLLGGNYRDRIKPYASMLFDDPPRLREKLLEQRARGFRAIKIGWRPFGRVSRQVRRTADQDGPRHASVDDVELMVDAGGSEQFWPHGVAWARETASMLGDYGVVWFEEALKPDDVAGFQASCAQTSPVLIATRRGPHAAAGVSALHYRERALDIIQPDVTKCGGLSEARRLGWMAYDHGVLLVPHGWNTGVGVAADLALVAALPVARWVEFQTGVPYIEEISRRPFQLDAEGMLPIPDGPGLGIELNPDAIARYAR